MSVRTGTGIGGRRRRSPRWASIAVLPLGLTLSGFFVWQGSEAAFTAQTSNPGNSFSAGTVTLSDDDTGVAMFTMSGLRPGSTDTKCITVTYTGSLAATVKLYVAPGDYTGTGLGTYLNLTVQEGTGGSYASCTGFVSSAADYTGTLGAFAAARTSSATGVGSFAPTAGQSRAYRFTYTLADNNAAQGLNSQVTLTWEAASS